MLVVSAIVGLPLGILWWLVAPQPLVQRRADGIYRLSEIDESSIAADGWFAVLALATGVVAGLVGYLLTRPGRIGPLVGLVVGGVVGSVVAWRLGVLLGPSSLTETARHVAVGERFHGPLELSALGVLLAWPMGAVITYFAVAAGAETHEHEPAASPGGYGEERPDWSESQPSERQ